MTEPLNPSANQPKAFVLRRRKRVPVETTLGRHFARHIIKGDLPILTQHLSNSCSGAGADYYQLGKTAILRLVCVDESGDRRAA